jgi:hypothetical protein
MKRTAAKIPKAQSAAFVGEIVRLDSGLRHHVLPVPDAVGAAWQKAKIRRLVGTLNGQAVNRALQSHADGGYFLLLGQDVLRQLGLKRGSRVQAVLGPDPEPDTPEMPAEFALVLAEDAAALARWDTFTPGARRSLIHYVASAKQEPTRIKRALELALKLRTRTLHSDRQRTKTSAKNYRPEGVTEFTERNPEVTE